MKLFDAFVALFYVVLGILVLCGVVTLSNFSYGLAYIVLGVIFAKDFLFDLFDSN